MTDAQKIQIQTLATAYAAYQGAVHTAETPEQWNTVYVWATILRDAQNALGVVMSSYVDATIETARRNSIDAVKPAFMPA